MSRPSKYRKEFHNEEFLRLSKQGKWISQVAMEWDVSRTTIYEWAKAHPEFLDTIKKGRDFAEGWYMNLGQLAMLGQATVNGQKVKVDVGMYVWLTKNLFKWSDKVETNELKSLDDDRPLKHLTDEELDKL